MSDNQKITQAIISDQADFKEHQKVEKFALFSSDGTPYGGGNVQYAPYVAGNAIGTAGKTVSGDEPAANTIVPIKFTNGNSAATPTVAFNGGSARAIQLGGTATLAANITLAAGGVALFWFDGTILHQIGVYS